MGKLNELPINDFQEKFKCDDFLLNILKRHRFIKIKL